MDREIHGKSNMWSITHRLRDSYRHDTDVGFE